jgi:5-methylcytosine-specific restriction endonuclease McrA
MSNVLVLDSQKRPRDPIHPGYARWLLSHQKAAVFKRYPFTILLREPGQETRTSPLRLKMDQGLQTTGLALVNDQSGAVVWAAELSHRGQTIKKRLDDRRAVRRSRRQRKTRYRAPRFANRRGREGKLPPSLESRVANVLTWVARLRRLCPLAALSMEVVHFDTHLMQQAEITGIAYQHGTLAGYEVREYLLEKWERTCAYCGQTGVPLEMEHVVPRARGGSNRVSNLTLACVPCNQQKGTRTAAEFGFPHLHTQAQRPLREAAAMNTTRWVLYEQLTALGMPVEVGTGGRTKWNRTKRGLPKTHWLSAACIGASTPETVQVAGVVPLVIRATGWQSRQMCRMDRYGFPRTRAKQQSQVQGFRTGDMVRAVVAAGKKQGTYIGRVAVRATGSFNLATSIGTVQGIAAKWCQAIHHKDGYSYVQGGATSSRSPEGEGCPSPTIL